jgi:hypothetical protein
LQLVGGGGGGGANGSRWWRWWSRRSYIELVQSFSVCGATPYPITVGAGGAAGTSGTPGHYRSNGGGYLDLAHLLFGTTITNSAWWRRQEVDHVLCLEIVGLPWWIRWRWRIFCK